MTAGDGPGAFVHEALFYRDPEAYLQGCLRFLREGLALAEPVLVAVPGPNLQQLRVGLGDAAAGVRFIEADPSGPRGARRPRPQLRLRGPGTGGRCQPAADGRPPGVVG